jgi:hypothetical protein
MANKRLSKRDRRIIVAMLTKIEKHLGVLVRQLGQPDSEERFRKDLVEYFPGPWHEVEKRFREARRAVQKSNMEWKYLEGIGMTGEMLGWKNRFLDETLEHGGVRRFFKVAISIVGSLSQVYPVLEIVKEYKEIAEAAIRYPD